MRWVDTHLGGHISLFNHRVVIYGFNAMHIAINVRTQRWGYICFHPTMRCFGCWWPWYFYLSPNATPWAATFAIGPGVSRDEKRQARLRRKKFGHGFPVNQYTYEEIHFDPVV